MLLGNVVWMQQARRLLRRRLPAWQPYLQSTRALSFPRPSAANLFAKKRSTAAPSPEGVVAGPAESAVAAKNSALLHAVKSLEESFGKGAIMKLSSDAGGVKLPPVSVVSTGSLALDSALGVGGLARGRIVEIYGPEMSGKTTLALQVIAEAQKAGGNCIFVDAEHALDPSYASGVGVRIDDLWICQPDHGEQALEIVDTLVRSSAADVIVVDSVAALVPRAEIQGEVGELQIGLQARLMSQALRKITGNLARSNTVLIFINQLRMKIGVMFGNPETTPGGTALKFYASQRLDIRRESAIKKGDVVVGNVVRVKVVKNKLAPPFRTCSFELEFGKGIRKLAEILDLAADLGIVKRQGAWYSYGDVALGQGRDKAKAFLAERADLAAEVQEKVKEGLRQRAAGSSSSGDEDDETPAEEGEPGAVASAASGRATGREHLAS